LNLVKLHAVKNSNHGDDTYSTLKENLSSLLKKVTFENYEKLAGDVDSFLNSK
jgi:hypothetical protein